MNLGELPHAIELLNKAAPYELGKPRSALHANFGAMYPIYIRGNYIRGNAYLAANRTRDAVMEFQKIAEHPGITSTDPIGALTHLQLGWAYAASGNQEKAKASFSKFLDLWKGADPDLPILRQARLKYPQFP